MLRNYISTVIMMNQSAHAKFSTSKKRAVLALTRFQFQPSAPPISNKDKRQKEKSFKKKKKKRC